MAAMPAMPVTAVAVPMTMIDLLGQANRVSGRAKRRAIDRRCGSVGRTRKSQSKGQQHRKNYRTHSLFLSSLDLELNVSKATH